MILSIETSAAICSVALHEKGKLLCSLEMHVERSHASALGVLITQAMALCHASPTQIEAVAVAKGPGSYTGLRLGASTAKGLCYGWNVPLIAVDSLLAMAAHAQQLMPHQKALLCPMLDARRMEVYRAIYNAQLEEVLPVEAHILGEDSFAPTQEVWYFGDGAAKAYPLFASSPHLHWLDLLPSAKGVGIVAWQHFQQGIFEDVAYFEPFYLKEFMAKESKCHRLLRQE